MIIRLATRTQCQKPAFILYVLSVYHQCGECRTHVVLMDPVRKTPCFCVTHLAKRCSTRDERVVYPGTSGVGVCDHSGTLSTTFWTFFQHRTVISPALIHREEGYVDGLRCIWYLYVNCVCSGRLERTSNGYLCTTSATLCVYCLPGQDLSLISCAAYFYWQNPKAEENFTDLFIL